MKRDSKLFITLHILAHLDAAGGHPTTSEDLAAHFRTNPVVIRRTLAGLREAGIAGSVKGHGGWTLARPAATIALGEVYTALGERGVLMPGQEPDSSTCLIEQAVNNALNGFYAEAEALLLRRLGEISLADIAADYRRHFAAHGHARLHTAIPGG